MFTKIISIFLLTFFLTYINSSLFSYTLFLVNLEEIVTDRCEKVVKDCEGKCYLNKSIEKKEKGTASENEIQRINISPVLYYETIKNDFSVNSDKALFIPFYNLKISNGYNSLEDKPPQI